MDFPRGIDHQPPPAGTDLFSEGRNGQFPFSASLLQGDPFADLSFPKPHRQPGNFLLGPGLAPGDRGKKGRRAKALFQSLAKVKQSCRRSHGPTLSGLTFPDLVQMYTILQGAFVFSPGNFSGDVFQG